jgi:hypothetical protein
MSEYDNNLTGIIGKNDRKEKDSQPDIKGNCEINGVQYWISGWKKDRKDGTGSFYSLRFEAKEQAKPAPKPAPMPQSLADMDSDIPFNNPYKGRFSYVV